VLAPCAAARLRIALVWRGDGCDLRVVKPRRAPVQYRHAGAPRPLRPSRRQDRANAAALPRSSRRTEERGDSASAQMALPVGRNGFGWPRNWLVGGMGMGRRQYRPVGEHARPVVEEPVLTSLEALYHRMAGVPVVCAGMLARRVVATADMPACGTSAQVQPPSRRRFAEAFDAASSAGWYRLVDVRRCAGHGRDPIG
jgi:hypothetical protein